MVGIIALIVDLELGELGSILPNVNGASYSYVIDKDNKRASYL